LDFKYLDHENDSLNVSMTITNFWVLTLGIILGFYAV